MGIAMENLPKEVGGKSEHEGLVSVEELLSEVHQQPAIDAFRREAKIAEASGSEATTPEEDAAAAAVDGVVPPEERARLRSLRKELYMAFENNMEGHEGREEEAGGGGGGGGGGSSARLSGQEEVRGLGRRGQRRAGREADRASKQLIIAAMIALFAMVVGLVYELIAGR